MIQTIWIMVIAACLFSFACSILLAAMLVISDRRGPMFKKSKPDHKTRRAILRKLNPNLIK